MLYDGKFIPPTDPVSFIPMILGLIESLIDRRDDDDKNTQMGIMTRDSDDDSIEWSNTPFEPTAELKGKTSTQIEHYTKRGATRLYEELTASRDGQLKEVATSWFDVGSVIGYSPTGLYFREVGPVVATAPGVTWNAGFTMDLEEAPTFKSEAWKDMAGEFQLSKREAEEGAESMILCGYNALEKMTKRNDGFRAVHPTELRAHGPGELDDRYFELATQCLAEFDGVHGPTDGPAWSYVDPTD